MLKYIELKTGYHDNGPAWIGRVKLSQSGRTVYFDGRALKQGARSGGGNFYDLETGDIYWVSGVKREGGDRHWAGSGKITIEAAAIDEYLALIEESSLDMSRFVISHDIRETDPAQFIERQNMPL
jgi:hypothetical protein